MLALAAGVAVVTALSAVWWARLQGPNGYFAAAGGGMLSAGVWVATGGPGTPAPGVTSGRLDKPFFPFAWRTRGDMSAFNGHLFAVQKRNGFGIGALWVELVLWPMPIVLGAGGWLLMRSGWRAWKRTAKGGCGKCGYDLSGIPEGRECPECGADGLLEQGSPS